MFTGTMSLAPEEQLTLIDARLRGLRAEAGRLALDHNDDHRRWDDARAGSPPRAAASRLLWTVRVLGVALVAGVLRPFTEGPVAYALACLVPGLAGALGAWAWRRDRSPSSR